MPHVNESYYDVFVDACVDMRHRNARHVQCVLRNMAACWSVLECVVMCLLMHVLS